MAKNFDPNFVFPPSIQGDLFNYLKPEQQDAVKPILRVLKKPAQMELCCTLLDYMEQGEATPPQDLTLAAMYMYLTRVGLGADMSKAIIRPLTCKSPNGLNGSMSSRGGNPQHISEIINSVFGRCFQK